jgi:tryptophan synthase alpha chain
MAARVRELSRLPLAVGFGLSRPEHVRAVAAVADAAVVGSALVSVIAEAGDTPGLVPRVEQYVRWLRGDATGVELRD